MNEKPEISQVETHGTVMHHSITRLAAHEDEPQTPYQLGWRTILALIALSLANCCAALSNTVRYLAPIWWLLGADYSLDKYNNQIPSPNTSKIPR
jgi:hypothetical protein